MPDPGENNFLAWSVTNVCVMYLLGTLWFTAALYSGVSGSQPVSRPEAAGRVAEEALGAAK